MDKRKRRSQESVFFLFFLFWFLPKDNLEIKTLYDWDFGIS